MIMSGSAKCQTNKKRLRIWAWLSKQKELGQIADTNFFLLWKEWQSFEDFCDIWGPDRIDIAK